MLERIGVRPGWRCLDLGCGAGGILELMAARAEPGGLVVGLDADAGLLQAARDWTHAHRAARTRFVLGDAYRTGLRPASFDLVHVRFVASTAGLAEPLLSEAISLARPGGVVAFQEPDTDALNCYPPHPAWTRLTTALYAAFRAVGGDTTLGQRLFALLRHAGLEDVAYRPFVVGVTSRDPMRDFLPATAESLRKTLVGRDIISDAELDRTLAECRAHLSQPETVFTTYLVAQVWGRTPGSPTCQVATLD